MPSLWRKLSLAFWYIYSLINLEPGFFFKFKCNWLTILCLFWVHNTLVWYFYMLQNDQHGVYSYCHQSIIIYYISYTYYHFILMMHYFYINTYKINAHKHILLISLTSITHISPHFPSDNHPYCSLYLWVCIFCYICSFVLFRFHK